MFLYNEKLKVAVVVNSFPVVSETFIISHITGLIDLGYDVDVLAFDKPSCHAGYHSDINKYDLVAKIKYINPVPIAHWTRLIAFLSILLRQLWRHPRLIWRCLRIKKCKLYETINHLILSESFLKGNYDIIHAHFGPIGRKVIFLKEVLLESKFITTFHGYDMSMFIKSDGEDVYRDLFTKGDLFLPVSEYWAKELVKLGCPQKKIKVHHMGINVSLFNFLELKSIGNNIKILSIGRLTEKKGHEFVIRAIGQLGKKYEHLTYYIAGDGPLREKLELLVDQCGVRKNVRFLGLISQDEALKLYQEVDLFVLPSITDQEGDKEGIPVVLMEAMAVGCPVISTFHSGIPELIEHKKSGILVEEKDFEAIAKNIETFINNQPKGGNLIYEARKIIENEFDNKKLNLQLSEIYRELVFKNKESSHVISNAVRSMKYEGYTEQMNKNLPLVSVVIPTHERADLACQTVESVLNQTYPNIEIFVVDDGSTDDTRQVLTRFGDKIKYIYQENQGCSVARNNALKYVSGKYLGFLDDDDLWLENKVEEEVAFLEENPKIGFVYSSAELINGNGSVIGYQTKLEEDNLTSERLFQGNIILTPSITLIRKKYADMIDGFDTTLVQSSDYDYWLKLTKHCSFGFLDKTLTQYRTHEGGLSQNLDQRCKDHLKIFMKKEVGIGKSFFERWVRFAQVYYQVATLQHQKDEFGEAAKQYFMSVLIFPFIGFYHWPKEIQKMRFSVVYRILKVYGLIMSCLFKHFYRIFHLVVILIFINDVVF